MDIELITIGDELLTGHTIDSNSAFIASSFLAEGMEIKYITTTGDSMEMMEETFRTALSRAKIIITTGGLGPTDDDNTKKAIVKVFKRNLIFHEEVLTDIKERYAARGIELPAINQNQALLPQGATFFPNKFGSAVGLCISDNGRIFISLPGVPREMKQILIDEVIPFLKKGLTEKAIFVEKLRTTGIIESKLAEIITPDLKLQTGVKLAYLPTYCGVDLRIISNDTDIEAARDKALELSRFLEHKIGKYIYGKNSDSLEEVTGQLLKDNDRTLAVAESCTAGFLGTTITSVSGSSAWFRGGIIAYHNDIKENILGVKKEILESDGAVSEECAKAMADGARVKTESDYGLSITGIAGPDGGTDEKPVGLTYIGLATPRDIYARLFNFGKDRESNRIRATYAALELLRREILDIK